jgi:hypothetical protein
LEYSADFSRAPESLWIHVPQIRSWWHWPFVIVSLVLALPLVVSLILAVVVWVTALPMLSSAVNAVGWLATLPALLTLSLLQSGPILMLWVVVPSGFGVERVEVLDGVLRSQLHYRRIRHPVRLITLSEHGDLSVEAHTAGRVPRVHVKGRRAVPMVIRGRMTASQATQLADALEAAIAHHSRRKLAD